MTDEFEDSKLISKLTKEYGRVHSISTAQLKEELSAFGLDTRYSSIVAEISWIINSYKAINKYDFY